MVEDYRRHDIGNGRHLAVALPKHPGEKARRQTCFVCGGEMEGCTSTAHIAEHNETCAAETPGTAWGHLSCVEKRFIEMTTPPEPAWVVGKRDDMAQFIKDHQGQEIAIVYDETQSVRKGRYRFRLL